YALRSGSSTASWAFFTFFGAFFFGGESESESATVSIERARHRFSALADISEPESGSCGSWPGVYAGSVSSAPDRDPETGPEGGSWSAFGVAAASFAVRLARRRAERLRWSPMVEGGNF
ncbi:hypothetical protein B0H10DRAFT_2368190, partial [Mycena sp. CBHHK59/15]